MAPPREPNTGNPRREHVLRVACDPSKTRQNTCQLPVESHTCIRVNGDSFPFGTCFPSPVLIWSLKHGLENYRSLLIEQHPDWKMTIFGHTDSEGRAAYNKRLSQRRAAMIWVWVSRRDAAAYLEKYYRLERWGRPIIKMILQGLGEQADERTLAFYEQDAPNRRQLFEEYVSSDKFSIDERFFLDRNTKPAYVGCSEYNQLRDHSPEEFPDKQERRRLNALNRRVMIFYWDGNGPPHFPNCARVDCLGSKATSPFPGNQQFRCPFYWLNFAGSKCETLTHIARPMSPACRRLKILYDYLIKKDAPDNPQRADKTIYECTLLRILHKCFTLEDAKYEEGSCLKSGVNPWMMHPEVHKRFFEMVTFEDDRGCVFPYGSLWRWEGLERPGTSLLFSYRPANQRELDLIKTAMDNGEIPPPIREQINASHIPISARATIETKGSFWRRRILQLESWWITDTKNARGKQMIWINYERPYDIEGYLLNYRVMIATTTSSIDVLQYGKITPNTAHGNTLGKFDDQEISMRDFFENRSAKPHHGKRLNFLRDELLRVVFDRTEVNAGGRFDPQVATRKLAPPPGAPSNPEQPPFYRLWQSGSAVIPFFEVNFDGVQKLFEAVGGSGGGESALTVEAQFLVYYLEKKRDANSIYDCFHRGCRTSRNFIWRGRREFVGVDNLCKDRNRKCNPAECLGRT